MKKRWFFVVLFLIGVVFTHYYWRQEMELQEDLISKFYEVNLGLAYPEPIFLIKIGDTPLMYSFFTAGDSPRELKTYYCEKPYKWSIGDVWICSWNERVLI